ncbi:hydroxyacid dehydrogenase [Streptomyces boninensis]|uniref:hydroxyacid dehydrogenase n=1 Tax=Streptomyces boninensis TaxID=2039455 RepID=UPI003B21E23F
MTGVGSATIAVVMEERLRSLFFTPELWRELEHLGRLQVCGTSPAEAAAHLRNAEVVITGWRSPRLDAGLLAAAPRLRLVAHSGAAVRFLVSDELFARGIRVSQTGEAMAPAVAEVALTFTLTLLHRIHRFDHALHTDADFDALRYPDQPARELRGTQIGVIGASRTGRAYLEMIRALGARPLLTDPHISAERAAALGARLVPLDELMAGCRVVAVHAPSIPATRHMIGKRELALMPDGAGLVNTARSALIDTAALLDELRTGRIDAALDVYDEEPLPADHPLRTLPNALLTPHQAAAAVQVRQRQGRIVVDEIARWLAGAALRHEITEEMLATTA